MFFIRGLSTYGQDNAKWSVFDFGPVYRHLQAAIGDRGIEFHPVLGLGAGNLREVTTRANAFLDQHPVWTDKTKSVHLLGHSAGGLVVRMLLPNLKREVRSALTVATPNRGSGLAELVTQIPEKYRGSDLILKTFGYNVSRKLHFFRELTPENVARVLSAAPTAAAMAPRLGSIVCSAPRSEWCLPLKTFYKIKAFDDFRVPSDGFVERDTQPFGDVIAELNIDHFRQVGLFRKERQFEELCDQIAGFVKS